MDRMTMLWTVTLFPQPFQSLPNGPMNNVAMVIEMGVMHGLDSMDFHSPRLTWLQLLLSARPANSRDQHWAPEMAPVSGMTSDLVAGWTTSSIERTAFVLTKVDTYFGFRFAFPACNVSTKTMIC